MISDVEVSIGMESFADRAISAMCASNIVDQHIQNLINREDGLLVIIKVPQQDSEKVKERFCSVLRQFANHGNAFKATTQAFTKDGFDYMVALLIEEEVTA